MSEISFNSIRDGVSLALHAAFPAPAQIHGGGVRQGLKAGDFNVVMPGAGHQLEVGRRYRRDPTVDVIYYPHKDSAGCYDVADKLTNLLERIKTPEGDVLHASSCTWNVTDGVLHVVVAYSHHVFRPHEQTVMDELQWGPGGPGALGRTGKVAPAE